VKRTLRVRFFFRLALKAEMLGKKMCNSNKV
jgi:hypothetical protein